MYSTSCSSTNPHNTNITPLLHRQDRQTSQRKAYSGPTVCLYTCCTAWCSRAQLQQPSPSTDRHRGCHFVTSDTRNSATYIQPFHLPQRQSRSLARPSNTSNLSNSRFLCEYVCLYDQLTPHSFNIPRRHFLLRSTAHSSNTTHSIKCPRHQPQLYHVVQPIDQQSIELSTIKSPKGKNDKEQQAPASVTEHLHVSVCRGWFCGMGRGERSFAFNEGGLVTEF